MYEWDIRILATRQFRPRRHRSFRSPEWDSACAGHQLQADAGVRGGYSIRRRTRSTRDSNSRLDQVPTNVGSRDEALAENESVASGLRQENASLRWLCHYEMLNRQCRASRFCRQWHLPNCRPEARVHHGTLDTGTDHGTSNVRSEVAA